MAAAQHGVMEGSSRQEWGGGRANGACFPGTSIVPQALSLNNGFRALPEEVEAGEALQRCLLQSQILLIFPLEIHKRKNTNSQ